jgi:hypothetical protein
VCVQDAIEVMREGMFDAAPLAAAGLGGGGLGGGEGLLMPAALDFRRTPGSRGGKAGEAARFMAALRAAAAAAGRNEWAVRDLQVRACHGYLQHRVSAATAAAAHQYRRISKGCLQLS